METQEWNLNKAPIYLVFKVDKETGKAFGLEWSYDLEGLKHRVDSIKDTSWNFTPFYYECWEIKPEVKEAQVEDNGSKEE